MRRLSEDGGAVAVIVALLSVVLLGFGALVIDVGALYYERRQLQVGADSAALAIAQACANGDCGSFTADAEAFADGNALDGAARIKPGGVCGSTGVGLPACTDPPTGLAGSGYVRVTAYTEEADGTFLVPPFLARVLVPDYDGTEVSANAVVAWGPPGGVDAELALTFSQCEYENLTTVDGETVYAEQPFDDDAALERTIYFHDTTEASSCPAGPSGADVPGGFGWLEAEENCTAVVTSGWVGDDTGASASKDCKDALDAVLGKELLIPVFNQTNGLTGTNAEYRIWSYVGFVLTGYSFPGASYPAGKDAPCDSKQTCIRGYFVETVAPADAPIGSGPDQGVRVVQLVS